MTLDNLLNYVEGSSQTGEAVRPRSVSLDGFKAVDKLNQLRPKPVQVAGTSLTSSSLIQPLTISPSNRQPVRQLASPSSTTVTSTQTGYPITPKRPPPLAYDPQRQSQLSSPVSTPKTPQTSQSQASPQSKSPKTPSTPSPKSATQPQPQQQQQQVQSASSQPRSAWTSQPSPSNKGSTAGELLGAANAMYNPDLTANLPFITEVVIQSTGAPINVPLNDLRQRAKVHPLV